jgi:hypothetical protein
MMLNMCSISFYSVANPTFVLIPAVNISVHPTLWCTALYLLMYHKKQIILLAPEIGALGFSCATHFNMSFFFSLYTEILSLPRTSRSRHYRIIYSFTSFL